MGLVWSMHAPKEPAAGPYFWRNAAPLTWTATARVGGNAGSCEIAELRLGKRIEALLEEAATLHKKRDRYAYGTPAFRFSHEHVDHARAAGVVIEFERGAPVIVDSSLYRELANARTAR